MADQIVYLDKGVTIAERRYPHGAVVDKAKLVEKPEPTEVPEDATEEDKILAKEADEAAKVKYEEDVKQANEDYDAFVKEGVIGPAPEKPAEPAKPPAPPAPLKARPAPPAAPPAKKEG